MHVSPQYDQTFKMNLFWFAFLCSVSALPKNATKKGDLPIDRLGIDPRFTVETSPGVDLIDEVSVQMNTIRYLGLLSLQPFTGIILEAESVSQSPWNDVTISFAPFTHDAERRFAIWGLYLGFTRMVSSGSFTNFAVYCSWEGRRIGVVLFDKRRTQQSLGSTNATIVDVSENETLDIPENRQSIENYFLPHPRGLSRTGIFVTMAGALLQAAEKGRDNLVRNFNVADDISHTKLMVEKINDPGEGGRNFRYSSIAASCWDVAKWLTAQNRYFEFISTFKWNNVPSGLIRGTKQAVVASA